MVNWNSVIIGIIVAIILGFVLNIFVKGWGGLIGFIAAALYTGYAAGSGIKSGSLHGALVGLVIGIISAILATYYGFSSGILVAGTGILRFVAVIIIITLVCTIGGAVGAAVKGE